MHSPWYGSTRAIRQEHTLPAVAFELNYNLQAGEFQCYDERALASLAATAAAVDEPEWGKEGPHDAGEYNSWPEVHLPCCHEVALRMVLQGTQSASILSW